MEKNTKYILSVSKPELTAVKGIDSMRVSAQVKNPFSKSWTEHHDYFIIGSHLIFSDVNKQANTKYNELLELVNSRPNFFVMLRDYAKDLFMSKN
ncbi:MAG: hypothetical protein FWG18_00045 [Alphaproteobacteria bacterium]|nr:hypothetical protein [Alphaproteobacteria bacterium]